MLINSNKDSYRKDITGLRAIAVLSVVIFHIFPLSLKGGYLGVDIFFVISGYLIGSILIKEKEKTGKVDILNFYRKRLLRIQPAMLVLIVLTSIFAYLVVDFRLLASFAKSIIYAVIGAANIYFRYNLDTSYFAPSVNTNLLLHLWSLGVEWQFYILLPIILIFIKKRYLLITLLLLFVASIIVTDTTLQNYYMLTSRAFELLIGVIGGYIGIYYKGGLEKLTKNSLVNNIASAVAIIFILLSLYYMGENYKMPNMYSLIIILPTILLIIMAVNKTTLVHKVLSNIAFFYIGLWSYSIYLYHWVLISFYHNVYGEALTLKIGIALILVSILLGAISYYLVESPTLRKKWKFYICFLTLILLPLLLAKVYFWKVNHTHYYSSLFASPPEEYPHVCKDYGYGTPKDISLDNCIINKQKGEPNILLIGDSNAFHYLAVFEEVAKKLNFAFRNEEYSGCKILTIKNIKEYSKYKSNKTIVNYCYSASEKLLNLAMHYDVVILSQYWAVPLGVSEEEYIKTVGKTITELQKTAKIVIIIAHAPNMERLNLRSIAGSNILNLKDLNRNKLDDPINKTIIHINNLLKKEVSKHKNVYFVEGFRNAVCSKTECEYKSGKHSLYFDTGHYSVYGEKYIAKKYIEKGIEPVWYKVKALYKDRTNIKVLKNGVFIENGKSKSGR